MGFILCFLLARLFLEFFYFYAERAFTNFSKQLTESEAFQYLQRFIPTLTPAQFSMVSQGQMMRATNGIPAWGAVLQGMRLLALKNENGTTYQETLKHEAMHFVFRYFTPESIKSALYTAAEEVYNMKGASKDALEERMAENFQKRQDKSKFALLLHSFFNWLKKIFGFLSENQYVLEQYYSKVENGDFSTDQNSIVTTVATLPNLQYFDNDASKYVHARGVVARLIEVARNEELEQGLGAYAVENGKPVIKYYNAPLLSDYELGLYLYKSAVFEIDSKQNEKIIEVQEGLLERNLNILNRKYSEWLAESTDGEFTQRYTLKMHLDREALVKLSQVDSTGKPYILLDVLKSLGGSKFKTKSLAKKQQEIDKELEARILETKTERKVNKLSLLDVLQANFEGIQQAYVTVGNVPRFWEWLQENLIVNDTQIQELKVLLDSLQTEPAAETTEVEVTNEMIKAKIKELENDNRLEIDCS